MHDYYFFTDIHGNYPLFKHIINWCKAQDPECTIIYGGDAADRGTMGYDIMYELLEDPQVIYLKGNHEELFVKSARELLPFVYEADLHTDSRDAIYDFLLNLPKDNTLPNWELHCFNGGAATIVDWIDDGYPEDILDRLDNLPLVFSYGNKDFCHAGGVWESFMRVTEAYYNNKLVDAYDEECMLWNRTAWRMGWARDRICIHGHTPVFCLNHKSKYLEKRPHPLFIKGWYDYDNKYPGYKLDMDMGTAVTGYAYVLNVLTMTAYGFRDYDFESASASHRIAELKPMRSDIDLIQ